MKQNTFFKVMTIIMLVCGILAAVLSVIPAAISFLGALVGLDFIDMLILIVATLLSIAGAVLQIVAGAKGLGACKDPSKMPACIKLGIAIIILCLVSNILAWIAPGGSLDIKSLVLNLVVPGLYVYSATQK